MTSLSPMFDDDYLKNPDDYVTLYRGREHYWRWSLPETQRNLNGLGMHWTTDPRIAAHFAAGHNDFDVEPNEETGRHPYTVGGHVITARVHKSGIIEPGTPEWQSIAKKHGIMDYENDPELQGITNTEREVTVRPGTPLYVTNVVPVKEINQVASPELKDALPQTPGNAMYKKHPFATGGFGPTLVDKAAVAKGGYVKRGRGTA